MYIYTYKNVNTPVLIYIYKYTHRKFVLVHICKCIFLSLIVNRVPPFTIVYSAM